MSNYASINGAQRAAGFGANGAGAGAYQLDSCCTTVLQTPVKGGGTVADHVGAKVDPRLHKVQMNWAIRKDKNLAALTVAVGGATVQQLVNQHAEKHIHSQLAELSTFWKQMKGAGVGVNAAPPPAARPGLAATAATRAHAGQSGMDAPLPKRNF